MIDGTIDVMSVVMREEMTGGATAVMTEETTGAIVMIDGMTVIVGMIAIVETTGIDGTTAIAGTTAVAETIAIAGMTVIDMMIVTVGMIVNVADHPGAVTMTTEMRDAIPIVAPGVMTGMMIAGDVMIAAIPDEETAVVPQVGVTEGTMIGKILMVMMADMTSLVIRGRLEGMPQRIVETRKQEMVKDATAKGKLAMAGRIFQLGCCRDSQAS